jgi:hypothetical protein
MFRPAVNCRFDRRNWRDRSKSACTTQTARHQCQTVSPSPHMTPPSAPVRIRSILTRQRTQEDDGLWVRASTPTDRPQVERLLHEGFLSRHVDCESREAQRNRQSLGTERDKFLAAKSEGEAVRSVGIVEGWRYLVGAAAEHAHQVGLLKLLMHAGPAATMHMQTAIASGNQRPKARDSQ